MAAPVIQFKRGLLTNLPGLRAGEPGFTTDAYDLYVGIDSTSNNNQFVGSGRYWQVNTSTVGSGVKLVEGTDNGTNSVTIKSPDSLAASYTLTMPADDGNNGDLLTSDGSGGLTFAAPASSSFTLAADSGSNDSFSTGGTLTFSGTANEIETTVSNDEITFSLPATINANTTGTAATATAADTIKTISRSTNANHHITFVDSNNGSSTAENLYTDDGLVYNPSNNVLGGSGANFVSYYINGVQITSTAAELNVLTGIAATVGALNHTADLGTFTGTTVSDNIGIKTAIQEIETALETVTGGNAQSATVAVGATDTDAAHFLTFVDSNNASPTQENIETDAGITYNPNSNLLTVGGEISVTTLDIGGTNVTATAAELNVLDGIASLDTDLTSVSSNDDTLASAKAIKTYVDSQVTAQDLDLAGDSGTGAVDLDSQSLTIAGTSNEIETSASGQTVTVGLPDAVTVTTSVTTPTVKASAVQANDGTAAITITDSTGAVATSSNLTVGGNLIVNGSTTQVNTSQTTIEDQLLELGMVDGSAPSSDLNVDIGLIFNYYTSSAKKAAVFWDDSSSRIVVSNEVTESTGVLTNSAAGALEIGSLYVNDCAGNTQVINCSGTTRSLENISIDGGSF